MATLPMRCQRRRAGQLEATPEKDLELRFVPGDSRNRALDPKIMFGMTPIALPCSGNFKTSHARLMFDVFCENR